MLDPFPFLARALVVTAVAFLAVLPLVAHAVLTQAG
jgi:hypothetical protein